MTRAIKEDTEKWLNVILKELEEDMRRPSQGNFKKMKLLTSSKVRPTGIILDEASRPLYKAEEKLAGWKWYFEKVLNVQNALAMAGLEDHMQGDTPEGIEEEVEREQSNSHRMARRLMMKDLWLG